jgi:UDP-galactopyranose mutase
MRDADILCYSHHRWSPVLHRTHHLMIRAARERRVFFVEEARFSDTTRASVDLFLSPEGVRVLVPYVPTGTAPGESVALQRELLARLWSDLDVEGAHHWFTNGERLGLIADMPTRAVVYDCSEGPDPRRPALAASEAALLRRADVVFTAGDSLFQPRRRRHPRVHDIPSGVDLDAFRAFRRPVGEPSPGRALGHPRIGYAGPIDNRVDVALLAEVAALRPNWEWVLCGALGDGVELPRMPNVTHVGPRPSAELPEILAGWDVAVLPYDPVLATRYGAPCLVPEALAAGLPVVSTAVPDIVKTWGYEGIVDIARDAAAFVTACERAMGDPEGDARRQRADGALADLSWDAAWRAMERVVAASIHVEMPALL